MPSIPRILEIINEYDSLLSTQEARVINLVNQSLEKSFRDLIRNTRKRYANYTPDALPSLLPVQRARLLLEEINVLLPVINPTQANELRGLLTDVLTESERLGVNQATAVSTLYQNNATAGINLAPRVDIEPVGLAVERSVKRFEKLSDTFADRAATVVGQGVIQGWGFQKMGNILSKELGMTKHNAISEVSTAVMGAYNQSAKNTYAKFQLELVQLVVTKDDRTCPTCSGRSMNVYRIDEIIVPLHFRCRCTIIPYDDEWRQLGLISEAEMREYRQQSLEAIKGEPYYGLSPFERAAGFTEPPEVIYGF